MAKMRTKLTSLPAMVVMALVLLAIIAACSSDDPTPTNTIAPTATSGPGVTSTPGATPTATSAPVVQPKYGGILRVAHRADVPAAWDTMRSTNYNLTPLTSAIAGEGNLVQACFADETTICPAFAESWEVNDDFTVWTFKVRDGLTFHDGAPLTAEEFRYWIDLFVNGAKVGDKVRLPGVAKSQFGDFKNVETLDGNRVRITLNTPDAFYLDSLGMHRIPIFHPKHLFEPAIQAGNVDVTPSEFGNIGAGPFKFVSYERGVGIEVERFDDYYEKDEDGNQLPFLDGIEYSILSDPAAFHAAFRTGRLDVGARGQGYYVSQDMVPQYQASLPGDVYFMEIAGGESAGLGFNTMEGPFVDKRLREAISLWIDRQSSIDTLNLGNGRIRAGFLDTTNSTPGYLTWPGYNPATKEADKAKARQLIADAGAQGLDFTIILPNTQVTAMEWWVGAIDGLGISADLQVMDVTAFDARKAGTDWIANWTGGSLDLGTPSSVNFAFGRKSDSPYAGMVHEDAKVAQLAQSLGDVTTNEDRLRILREIEAYIFKEQFYMIHGSVGVSLIPARGYVKGAKAAFVLNPPTYASFARTWMDK